MSRRIAAVAFAVYCTVWTILHAAFVVALNDEGLALQEFRSRLNDTRGILSDWDPEHSTPCKWTGITCSKGLHVVVINLSAKWLEGNLTLDIIRFPQLQTLNFSSNGFVGEIPDSFGNASSLKVLNLHSNHLSGAIPLPLSQLSNLEYLDLSNNQLQGIIPASLDNLSKLTFLNVSFNELEGVVPGGGALAAFNGDSYIGNARLCGVAVDRDCGRVRSLVDFGDGPLPESSSRSSKKALSVGAIVAICVCAFALSKVILGTLCYLRWKKMHTTCEIKLSGGKMVMFQMSGKATPSSKAVLRKAELLKQQDIIGSGGYGTVYKLELDDKTQFAVKKLARGGQDRERGFERELETLADIKHRNLVALRGYYSAPDINILVYDLMHNGNLDTWLHEHVKHGGKPLEWDTRLNIAVGSARGLSYLHHDCIPHIIHRDIKTSNILLDEDMEARVSDFGLAKLISPHQTHVTTMVAGTLGYLPPEYMETGKVTEKGDVYSFGIVLLELLTGKRPTDNYFMDNDFNMVHWAKTAVDEDHPEDIFDEYILGSCPDEDLLTALDIAFQCVVQQPQARPSMQQVVKMLERLRNDLSCAESSLGFSSHLTASQSGASSTASPMSSALLSL
ncbi:receptor-like serine/threonine-protein kinase At1g78530 [Physcomitrium patens]|uniref:Protein kinase domain-containing protein n=1 Tax=Physcomitrium patens TaxID=3218 RepID=A0A2K1L8C9_PHYPA|nr:receptor-like serine/threonine-protein kinase At1g78530 [Physcomitrium patens]PNR62290.1 hypothetical protein PHYPA_000714 [Physcomitrium patens]|eukprot:XP_024392016.1 receptor-like serine/threonine-protein kinase At1g78530 [Physcomitrella patens]